MVSEGVSVEKVWGHDRQDNFVPKWAQHTWEHMASLEGGRSLCISFDTAMINSLGVNHTVSQRLHLSWYCFLCRLRNGQMCALMHWHTSLGFGNYSLRLWGCWARDIGCGNPLVPFGQGWAHRHRQLQLSHSPLKKVIQAFSLELAKAHSICWRPLASSWLASALKWSASCLRKLGSSQ